MTRKQAYATLMEISDAALKVQARAIGRDELTLTAGEHDALVKLRQSVNAITSLMESNGDWSK